MIKSTFSIKDLENLSGVKAHTIRMWEKRYDLLEPNRSDTNIRNYSLSELQKILNVSYLKRTGMRISSIAVLKNDEIESKVRDLAQVKQSGNYDLQELKVAMVNFNEQLFEEVCEDYLKKDNFTKLFNELFIPFLQELGSLWHSNTINIAHEHFITNLISQKILVQTEKLKRNLVDNDQEPFILFLPENEMHDLGLLFLNYELLRAGFRTVFLGASMELNTLPFFQKNDQNPIFITFITVQPSIEKLPAYLRKFNKKLNQAEIVLLGSRMADIDQSILTPNQKTFNSIDSVVKHFQEQKLV